MDGVWVFLTWKYGRHIAELYRILYCSVFLYTNRNGRILYNPLRVFLLLL